MPVLTGQFRVSMLAVSVMCGQHLCGQQGGIEFKAQLLLQQPGGKAGGKQEEFSKQARPGPEKVLLLRVMADQECLASVAGFTRDGQLVYGVPEIVQLSANVIKAMPVSKKWTFNGTEQLAEMDLVVADPKSFEFRTYSDLVGKMSRPGLSDEVRQAQAGAIREWIDTRLRSGTTAQNYSVKENPVQVGGVVRGDGLPGPSIPVPAQKTTILRIRIQ